MKNIPSNFEGNLLQGFVFKNMFKWNRPIFIYFHYFKDSTLNSISMVLLNSIKNNENMGPNKKQWAKNYVQHVK